jgi:hypothetical protein
MLAPGAKRGGYFGVQFGAGTALALGIVLVLPWRWRRWTGISCLLVLLAVFFMASCGGGGGSTALSNPTTPVSNTPSGTYTVLVTGTANSIVHNTKVTVMVP